MQSTFYEKEDEKKDKEDAKIYEVTNKDYTAQAEPKAKAGTGAGAGAGLGD